MVIYVGVTSLGVGGVGKSTIALALATEFSRYDITILFDSSHIHKLLKSGTIDRLVDVKIIGNLIPIGLFENPFNPVPHTFTTSLAQRIVETVTRVSKILARDIKYVVIDYPAQVQDFECFRVCSVLMIVSRPYTSTIRKMKEIGDLIRLRGGKLIPVVHVINFWPPNLKIDSKTVEKVIGVKSEELRNVIIIPELDVVKNENSPLTVAKYIVEKGYLRDIVRKIRILHGEEEYM